MAELIYDEITLFGICMLLGAGLSLVYDLIRCFRLLIPYAFRPKQGGVRVCRVVPVLVYAERVRFLMEYGTDFLLDVHSVDGVQNPCNI